ncbi:MAG: prepilin-type N-terminal cleavage/methylation domain-containing protein [Negativicutes bacterium]|nr:prepilin-type N-terminal cleavage/methylation domain-containing protein [Negativicutes bacterium]
MNRAQAGFSLMELVVGMAMMLLVMGGVAALMTSLLGQGIRGMDLTDHQQEARWALDMVAQDVRFATAFNTAAGSGAVVDIKKNDSTGTSVRVRYELISSGSRYVLTRSYFNPATATTATAVSPVGNPNKDYVGAGDFGVTVTTVTGSKQVAQVSLTYNVRTNSTDTTAVTAHTTIYPLNNPQVP